MDINDKNEIINDFKNYLIAYYNDNVYDEMKSFLSQIDIDDDDYRDCLDYMCRKMTGAVVWDEEA